MVFLNLFFLIILKLATCHYIKLDWKIVVDLFLQAQENLDLNKVKKNELVPIKNFML